MSTITLLTIQEAADYLGLTHAELHAMMRNGQGPGWTELTPRTVRYDLEDLDHWLANQDAPLPGL